MVYLIIILGLSVLWSRVLLEMAIVLFNISNSLKSIDRKVPER